MERIAKGKRNLNADKISNIITGVCFWSRRNLFLFEDSNRIIKYWDCATDN